MAALIFKFPLLFTLGPLGILVRITINILYIPNSLCIKSGKQNAGKKKIKTINNTSSKEIYFNVCCFFPAFFYNALCDLSIYIVMCFLKKCS